MIRTFVIAGAVGAALGCLPASAQQVEELDGAPGYRAAQDAQEQAARRAEIQKQVERAQKQAAQKQAAQKQAAAKQKQTAAGKAKSDQAQLAKQTEARKLEQARLAKQAEDLKAQQAKLDARAQELAAEEQRLAQLRKDIESEQAIREAELARLREEASRQPPILQEVQTAEAPADASAFGAREEDDEADSDYGLTSSRDLQARGFARANYYAAEASCARVARQRARERDFYSASYDGAPHFYQGRDLELRGRMRLEDRRGYLLVDTVCEVDTDGEARRFVFLR
jgi:hypothetical protein